MLVADNEGFNPGKRDFFVATFGALSTGCGRDCFNPGKRDFFVATIEGVKEQDGILMVSIPASGIFL